MERCQRLKGILNELRKQVSNIPLLFFDPNHTLWLAPNRFGMKHSGNIIYKTERHGFVIRKFSKFFINPPDETWDEVARAASEFLLFSKSDLNAEDILKCTNLEIRRELLRRFGYEKFIEELKGIVISRDKYGELIKIKFNLEIMKFVKVRDASTERDYFIRVPPETKSAWDGIAWTFGMKRDEYNPKKET